MKVIENNTSTSRDRLLKELSSYHDHGLKLAVCCMWQCRPPWPTNGGRAGSATPLFLMHWIRIYEAESRWSLLPDTVQLLHQLQHFVLAHRQYFVVVPWQRALRRRVHEYTREPLGGREEGRDALFFQPFSHHCLVIDRAASPHSAIVERTAPQRLLCDSYHIPSEYIHPEPIPKQSCLRLLLLREVQLVRDRREHERRAAHHNVP
mmetsp:Transcript_40983/g.99355  ORF Transcript_40983/g.99355 Transcript_40983/m.99355 type:complete len:206 (-) Transcript_40983:645-1262(-)